MTYRDYRRILLLGSGAQPRRVRRRRRVRRFDTDADTDAHPDADTDTDLIGGRYFPVASQPGIRLRWHGSDLRIRYDSVSNEYEVLVSNEWVRLVDDPLSSPAPGAAESDVRVCRRTY